MKILLLLILIASLQITSASALPASYEEFLENVGSEGGTTSSTLLSALADSTDYVSSYLSRSRTTILSDSQYLRADLGTSYELVSPSQIQKININDLAILNRPETGPITIDNEYITTGILEANGAWKVDHSRYFGVAAPASTDYNIDYNKKTVITIASKIAAEKYDFKKNSKNTYLSETIFQSKIDPTEAKAIVSNLHFSPNPGFSYSFAFLDEPSEGFCQINKYLENNIGESDGINAERTVMPVSLELDSSFGSLEAEIPEPETPLDLQDTASVLENEPDIVTIKGHLIMDSGIVLEAEYEIEGADPILNIEMGDINI